MTEPSAGLTRRAALKLSVIAAASGLLAGCASNPRPEPTASPKPNPTQKPINPLTTPPVLNSEPSPTLSRPSDRNIDIPFASRGDPTEPRVAITIDDFTYPYVVKEGFVPLLDAHPDLRLTLFPIGDRVAAVEEVNSGFWRWALDQGHEIGFHSMHHDDLGKRATAELLEEVNQFNQIMGQALGDSAFQARYGRPPFGNYGDWTQFIEVGTQLGMTWVLWSTTPSSAAALSLDLPEAITPGDVALFHIRWQDITKLPAYLAECRSRGLEFVTLSQLRLIPYANAPATP